MISFGWEQTLAWFQHLDIRIVESVIVLLLFALAARITRRALRLGLQHLKPHIKVGEERRRVLEKIATAVFGLLTLLVILGVWGIQANVLWAGLASVLAVAGVGLIATWAMVSNWTAWLLIVLSRPFHLGDEVELKPENLAGRVVKQGLLFTELRQEDGACVVVPNNFFFQRIFVRRNHAQAPTAASAQS